MNKKSTIIAVAIAVVIVLACGLFETNSPQTKGEGYCTVIDSEKNEVVLFEKPKKVAVLFSSLAEVWQCAGGEVAITVGETVERGLCDGTVYLVDSGAGKTVNNELLVSLEPDLVICSADVPAQKDTAKILRQAEIAVLEVRLDTFEDYLSCLKSFVLITGEKENHTTYGENVKKEIEAVLSASKKAEGEKFLFIRSGSSASSAKAKKGDDNFAAKIIEDFGCANIADSAEILLDSLSVEEIIEQNPDYIFVSPMGDEKAAKDYITGLFESEPYQLLSAVKENKVYFLPKELFQYKPCARWSESYRYIAEIFDNE